MARVIPSGTTDYTTQIAMREAAANDALTRLFYTMIMRREERERNEALRRELLQNQQDFTLRRDEMFRQQREDEYERIRRDNPATRPSKLGVGTGQSSAPRTAPAPAAAPAPTQGPRDPTQFNAPGGTVGPNPNQFSAMLNSIYAQADDQDVSDGGTVELSAQRQQRTGKSLLPGYRAPQMPRQPRPKKSEQSVFAGETPEHIATAWDASERKYGLARGTLQALMGLYNQGGADDGTDDDGTDRLGWFKFSAELRKMYNISDQDALDPVKMGEFAARNLKRNVDATNKLITQYNAKNGTNHPLISANRSTDVPTLAVLSQLGVHDGPAAVLQSIVYDRAPIADALSKGPDGKPRDGGRVLINIGHPADTTGAELRERVAKQINPYFEETVRSQDQGRPVGPRTDVQNAVPRPPADVGGGDSVADYLISRGVKPDRVTKISNEMRGRIAYVMQKAEEATGSRMSVSSSYRSPEEQAQLRADMRGVRVHYGGQIYYPTPGKRSRGMVAGPGHSRHNFGEALDFNDSPGRRWLRHTKEGRDLLRETGLVPLAGDEPHIQLTRGPLPAFTYPGTQTATTAPQQQQAAPQPPPPAPPAAVVKPAVASVDVPTFDARVFPPLATMPDAQAGIQLTPRDVQVAQTPLPTPRPAEAPQPQVDPATAAAGNTPTPQTAPAAPADTPTTQPIPTDRDLMGNPLVDRDVAPTGNVLGRAADVITGPPQLPIGSMLDKALGTTEQAPMPGLSVEEFLAGPAPEYQSATDNPFEAESYPGKYTGGAIRGANDIMQSIYQKAKDYITKPDYSTPPMEPTIPRAADKYTGAPPVPRTGDERYTPPAAPIQLPNMPQVDFGYLKGDRIYDEQNAALERRLANPPPDTQGGGWPNFSYNPYSPEQAQQEQALRDAVMAERNAVAAQTPPQESYSPAPSNTPTRTSQPTAEAPPSVTGSPESIRSPTPADITGAIFNSDQVGSGGLNLDWIKRMLNRKWGGGSSDAGATYQREDQLNKPLVRGKNTPSELQIQVITPPPPPDPFAIPKRKMPDIAVKPPPKGSSTTLSPEQLGIPSGTNVPSRKDYAPGKLKREGGKVIDTTKEKKPEEDEEQ